MPYKDPNSPEAKASLRRRKERYATAHPDRVAVSKAKNNLSAYHRSYHRRHKYGLSEEDCRAWLVKQGGACAVCRMPLSIMARFTIDHDHKCCDSVKTCGKCVRGILCNTCNAGLGYLKDSIDLLLQAVDYLRRNS